MNNLTNYDLNNSYSTEDQNQNCMLINRVLDIYRPEFRFVKKIYCHNEIFYAEIVVDKYPYTQKQIFSYVTGPTLTLLVGQVAYIYTAYLIVNNKKGELNDISLEKYLALRDDEKLVFGCLDFKFKRKIPMNKSFTMKMNLVASKRMRNFIYGRFTFEVERYLSGKTNFVMGLK